MFLTHFKIDFQKIKVKCQHLERYRGWPGAQLSWLENPSSTLKPLAPSFPNALKNSLWLLFIRSSWLALKAALCFHTKWKHFSVLVLASFCSALTGADSIQAQENPGTDTPSASLTRIQEISVGAPSGLQGPKRSVKTQVHSLPLPPHLNYRELTSGMSFCGVRSNMNLGLCTRLK